MMTVRLTAAESDAPRGYFAMVRRAPGAQAQSGGRPSLSEVSTAQPAVKRDKQPALRMILEKVDYTDDRPVAYSDQGFR